MRSTRLILMAACACGLSVAAQAETIDKKGTKADGSSCSVRVERHADGRLTTLSGSGSSASSSSSGSVSSSSSAGGSSVQIQAGNGSVSSSSSMAGQGGSSASAGSLTVNGCTVSTN